MPNVTVAISGGPSVDVAWKQNMTAQDALEAAYVDINNSSAFTYSLQFYGSQLGYLVMMINETYDSFISSAEPFFYWEFLLNGQPASQGIDNTVLSAGDVVGFSFEQYVPAKHKGSLLETKRKFQMGVTQPRK